MDHQHSSAAPSARSVLIFVISLAWRSKWLIGGAVIVAAATAYALAQANTVQTWSGRTTLTIGLAPTPDYILHDSGAPTAVIETPRSTIARISDPIFRNKVLSRAAFEPATAAVSRPMVSSSLRAIDLNADRDVAVELSAGSAADVQAAFGAIAAEISQAHGEILNKRLQLLQNEINDAKSRIAVLEKSSDELNERIFNAASGENSASRVSVFMPGLAMSIPAWNELRDRIQRDTNLKELSEPSALHLETDAYLLMPRSVGALRASILAGLAMLVAMIVLTVVVNPLVRRPADRDSLSDI
jgi:hypothetical protein